MSELKTLIFQINRCAWQDMPMMWDSPLYAVNTIGNKEAVPIAAQNRARQEFQADRGESRQSQEEPM